jgi:hypothetical protein
LSGTITTNHFSPVSGKTTPVVLVVSPSLNAEGRKAYSTGGQLFDGKVDGRTVVKRSTTPFCDAARVLLAEGVRPEAKIVMRHSRSLADALRSTVGAVAGSSWRWDRATVRDGRTRRRLLRQHAPGNHGDRRTWPMGRLCA